MRNLMKTFESLTFVDQDRVKQIANAARDEMRHHGVRPANDDEAAIFDEAVAQFFLQSRARQVLSTK